VARRASGPSEPKEAWKNQCQSPGGLLGADFSIENGRYKVTRIYDNESWNPDLRSPLSTLGVKEHPIDRALKEPPPPTWGVRPKH